MADSTASIGPKDNLAAIFEAARVGNLDQDRLNAYRKNHPEFDIDGRGGDGMTLLAIACHEGHDRLVRSLVSPLNNANPNALSDHGRSPAHYTAISESRKEKQQTILEVLIAKGANLNVSCADGCTPLMKLIIAPEASPQLISLLVDSGADVGLKNNRNQTATWLAKSTNRSEIMTALRPRDERDGTKRTIFSRLLDVLHYIFFCINAAVGWVKNVFGISGCDDEELKRVRRPNSL
jgi:ankyrin repeat protein